MFTRYDFERQMESDPEKYKYDKETKTFLNKDGAFLCTLDTFWARYAEKAGLSFDCIWSDHMSLLNVIRCRKCGTVVFQHDDESYEHNFHCPTCTQYKTNYCYWTKDEIENDVEKQDAIRQYEEFQKYADETYALEKKRGGLMFWQVWKKQIKTKGRRVEFELRCRDIRQGWWKDLFLEVSIWKRCADDIAYAHKKHWGIPLTIHGIYHHYIYVHLGKCPKEIRKKWYIGKAREAA